MIRLPRGHNRSAPGAATPSSTAARLFAAAILTAVPIIALRCAPVAAADGAPTDTPDRRELTPADALATFRVMDNQSTPGNPLDPAGVSPDGSRYVIRLAHGDAARNGVWLDILTGSLSSPSAAKPITCAHLFSTGLGAPRDQLAGNFDVYPGNLLRWIDDHTVAMLWSDEHHVRQVLSLDLNTCRTTFLTHSATNVLTFGESPDGTLLFDVKLPRDAARSRQLIRQGFTVSDTSDGFAILQGDMDGSDVDAPFDNTWLLRSAQGTLRSMPIAGRLKDPTSPVSRTVTIAPDGRLAIIVVGMSETPPVWDRYTDPSLKRELEFNRASPNRMQLQLEVVDLHTAATRPLWTAPKAVRAQVIWSPSGDSVLLVPSFLPASTDAASSAWSSAAPTPGLAGVAAAEVDPRSGAYTVLPIDLTARELVSAKWLAADYVRISTADATNADLQTHCFHKLEHVWQEVGANSPHCIEHHATHPIHLETRQSLQQPPQVFAVDAQGRTRLVLDTNPRLLTDFKLGRVERVSGTLPNGQAWIGQLIYPADYAPGHPYPLLMQSIYGLPWDPEEFTLDGTWGGSGMGLGPSGFASYPGQLLATQGFAVLTLEVVHRSTGPQEPEDYRLAFETAAAQLIASGLADRSKVALAGFSRNGYYVEYTLAHSQFSFAAAIAADNYDPSYFQAALDNWAPHDAAQYGVEAFGPGLEQWLRLAPGFNAEHINAPLLKIGQDTGAQFYIIGDWEVFSRVRHLHKPIEMYLMPDIDAHPAHNTQNPRQIMAIQARVIDWLNFWLREVEDPSAQKREQYAHWRKMRDTQPVTPTG